LPCRLEVAYLAKAIDWQPSVQSARRLAGAAAEAVATVELPLALGDDQARTLAEMLLGDAWASRDSFYFRTTAAFSWLDPGDVVMLDMRGFGRRLRILRTHLAASTLEIEAVADDAGGGAAAVGSTPFARLAGLAAVADVRGFLLDLPLLRDEDEGVGFYAAASFATGTGASWRGAVLHRSADGGASFDRLADLPGPAAWGICQTTLGDGGSVTWDDRNGVTVLMRQGALESRSALAVLNGANAALIGREIVQFRNAVLIGADTYLLSGLLRGRRGTEHHCAGHAADETLLLLTADDLARVRMPQNLIGGERLYKTAGVGQYLEDRPAHAFTCEAAGLRPYSVAHVRGRRDPGSGDWSITWRRRTRLHGGWIDGADVPLAEETEAYDVEVLDGGGAVRRRLAVNTPAATYGAAQQQADFGAPQASLRLRISQMSAIAGHGVGREVQL